jgi:sigma-E factor negative regulatory protein RseB
VAIVALAYTVGGPEGAQAGPVAPPLEEANAAFAASAGGYGLSDPAVDALLAEAGGATSAWQPGGLAPVAFGVGAATAALSMNRGDEAGAIRLLRRAMQAPARLAFRGVRTVRDYASPAGGAVRVAVRHAPGQGTSYRVLGGGSQSALFIDDAHDAGPADDGSDLLATLTSRYDVAVLGTDRMAGRAATVVGLGDAGSVVATFWIDDATDVVLGRDLFDDGALVRTSHFDHVTISRSGFMPHLPPALNAPAAPALPTGYARTLGDDGWACPPRLAEGLSLTALGRIGASGRVVEAVYSDGISSATVFEQRGALDASDLAGYSRMTVGSSAVYVRAGVPSTWIWESAGTVYTLLSDAPPAQVEAIVAGLPHDDGDDSPVERVGAGLRRIGDFLSPVG